MTLWELCSVFFRTLSLVSEPSCVTSYSHLNHTNKTTLVFFSVAVLLFVLLLFVGRRSTLFLLMSLSGETHNSTTGTSTVVLVLVPLSFCIFLHFFWSFPAFSPILLLGFSLDLILPLCECFTIHIFSFPLHTTCANINILGACHGRYSVRLCHQNHFNANFFTIFDK